MAKATVVTETKTITTGINLFLTPEEASVLLVATGKVGGSPCGYRGTFDRIRDESLAAKVTKFPIEVASGVINF